MKTITKTLLIGICALCFTTTGCAADGFFESASTSQSSGRPLFDPPPMPKQSLAGQSVRSPVQVTSQPTARASFQLSDTPSNLPDVQSMAMQSAAPTPKPLRLRLAPAVKKNTRTLVTLGPNDDLAAMVRAAPGVVLLDFYADWCGPCRTQGKILQESQTTAAGQNASIIKVNVDQHEAIASVLKVSSLPTLVLIKDGKIIERKEGLADQYEVGLMLAR